MFTRWAYFEPGKMSCQEEKQMLHLICSLFQESQQSSCVVNKPDSSSSASSHPWFFQTRPKKEKELKKKNGIGHEKVEGRTVWAALICLQDKCVSEGRRFLFQKHQPQERCYLCSLGVRWWMGWASGSEGWRTSKAPKTLGTQPALSTPPWEQWCETSFRNKVW